MAITYPETPIFNTRGEEKVFAFLKERLPDSWHLFYEPFIDDVTPDFVLFSPYIGALVLEVKDYILQTIKSITPNYWELAIDGRLKSILSPFEQARRYMHKFSRVLQSYDKFCNSSGIYRGKIIFPVACACWMVNIDANDAEISSISKVIPTKYLLTRDHFQVNDIELIFSKILMSKFTISELPHTLTNAFVELLYPSSNLSSYDANRKDWFISFSQNILTFTSVVDEAIFIATEIRHLFNKGIPASKIAVFVLENRYLRNRKILDEVQDIFKELGVSGIRVGVFCHLETELLNLNVFIMDIKPTSIDDEKEAALSKLLNEASDCVWFTSSCL